VTTPLEITIENDGIALRHASARDVARTRGDFRRLFRGQSPAITVRGFFPGYARRAEATEPLNLLDPPHGRVVAVDAHVLVVDLGPPLGVTRVDPSLGANVEVRFTLPKGER
jgi:hypothetical protein